jgi:hypothetical protein
MVFQLPHFSEIFFYNKFISMCYSFNPLTKGLKAGELALIMT